MNYEMLREMTGARPKTFAFVAFLVLLNLALLLYLSLWQKPELERAQNQWFADRAALARTKSPGSAARYRDGQRDLGLFRKRLIPKKQFPAFLSDVFEIARSNSLSLKGISYKPALIKDEGILAYGIVITVSGKYASVKSFIADLVRYPDMATVDALSLNSTSPTEESVDLKIQMTAYLKMEGA